MRDYTRIARKITVVLFLSQGLSAAGFIAVFTVNALVAVDLSGRLAMAGVPGAVVVLGQACGSLVLGYCMEWIGRRGGIALGQVIGVLGAGGGNSPAYIPGRWLGRKPVRFRKSCVSRG